MFRNRINLKLSNRMDNSELLNTLSQKLQTANKTIVLQKRREREQIQQRLSNIESLFNGKKKFESDSLERSKMSVQKINTLSNETVKSFNFKNRKEEELIRNLKDKIEHEIDICQREHQQRTEEIIEKQTQKMSQIIDQLSKKSRINSDQHEKTLYDLTKSLTILQKDFQDEVEQRQNNCNQIQEDISNEVLKFKEMIDRQRERRLVSEQKIQAMIDEITTKIKGETQTVTNKRKKNNAALLKLIQGACQRLEQKINIIV